LASPKGTNMSDFLLGFLFGSFLIFIIAIIKFEDTVTVIKKQACGECSEVGKVCGQLVCTSTKEWK
jgi:hypothetical protein